MEQVQLTRSPWGAVQQTKVIAEGLVFVKTASHGGLKLNRALNKRVPEYMRRKGGWYEEDSESAIPVIALKEFFSESEYRSAIHTLMQYYPEFYEKLFNRIIPPVGSNKKNQAAFLEKHANNLIGICAWGDWKEGMPKGSVLVLAKKGGGEGRSPEKERYFLVEARRYDSQLSNPGHFGYVIDETIDQEVQKEQFKL
ncbi:MAG: hypothetical protein HY036_08750 [Nitrospirae bacterium]|nr:hypothetical protein [Nitrospirota bacterium]